jgi:hypothetical protein
LFLLLFYFANFSVFLASIIIARKKRGLLRKKGSEARKRGQEKEKAVKKKGSGAIIGTKVPIIAPDPFFLTAFSFS